MIHEKTLNSFFSENLRNLWCLFSISFYLFPADWADLLAGRLVIADFYYLIKNGY